jgi:hypothetical protein
MIAIVPLEGPPPIERLRASPTTNAEPRLKA